MKRETSKVGFYESGKMVGAVDTDSFMRRMGEQVNTCNPASGRYNVAPQSVVERFNGAQSGDYKARLLFKGLDY